MDQHNHQHAESPEMLSLMGYSLARESGQYQKGIELCLKAITMNPHSSDNYLHLGRIYLLAKKKDLAIKAFRKGLRVRKDTRIIDELRSMGIRQAPPFASLPRTHVLNRFTGRILNALRLR